MYFYRARFIKGLLLFWFLFASTFFLVGQTVKKGFNYTFKNADLTEVVKVIQKNSSYSFIYSEEIKLSKRINGQIQSNTIDDLLHKIFSQEAITYKISGKHILLQKKKVKPVSRRFTISGYVTDGASKETLIGTNVFESRHQEGTSTNPYGFYSITIPEGENSIQYSYIGYAPQVKSLYLTKDTVINVFLKANAQLQEIVILSDKPETGIQATQMGTVDIPIDHIKKTPSLFGETDVMKTIQLMPGVQAGVEGSAGIYVRGGSPDQNLILLDGVPVYNIDHLCGFFSVFNPEAVKKVSLFKSSFPARFGGRLSSVIDIRTNDGDMNRYHGAFSIGLLSSKINFEGPIIKDKTSFNFSARRSYFDLVARPFIDEENKSFNYYFYDVNAKINHRFSDNSRLFISFYNGKDLFKNISKTENAFNNSDNGSDNQSTNTTPTITTTDDKIKLKWGNTISSVRWNYVINNKLFSNTTVSFNKYNFNMNLSSFEVSKAKDSFTKSRYEAKYQSGIKDWAYNLDFDYNPLPTHHIKFGSGYIYHSFRPEVLITKNHKVEQSKTEDRTSYSVENPDIYGHEISAYIEDNFDINNRLSVNAGLHLSTFIVQKESYFSAQPRISTRYKLTNDFTVKASYTKMSQYIHLLGSSAVSLPTDLWVPVTKKIKPMQAHQFSIGTYYSGIKGWEFSIESYFKKMINVLEYKDGSTFMGSSAGWENKVEMGQGRSFGIEFLAQKTTGKATGWIAYTLAKSDRKFGVNGINEGNRFPYKYDRRHNVNILFNYNFSDKVEFSSSWTFYTGGTITIPEQKTALLIPDYSNLDNVNYSNNGTIVSENYIENRNNYRLPSTHLLNIGINFNKKTKHGLRTWNLSIYNAYNSMNPTFVYKKENTEFVDGKTVVKPVLTKITVLPFIPSVTYTYKF